MFGDCKDDQQLRDIWSRFCDDLKQAGELIFHDMAPATPTDRAEGLRFIARNISLAMTFEMENCDPAHPEMMRYFDPCRKQGGDNSDAVYLGAPIDGKRSYRLSGKRGDARYLAFTVLESGDTPWGGGVIGGLFKDQLQCDSEGNFELYIGPEPPVSDCKNFIRSTPDTFRVTIRQFFADWENEAPMEVRIDCLSEEPPPPPMSTETLQKQLKGSGHWLQWSTQYWAEKLDKWRVQPNRFISFGEMEKLPIDATPGGTPLISAWELSEDEALIIRVTPPECSYWNCEFGGYWFSTVDYRYRLSGTNCHHAQLEEDGSLIVVVSHQDTGVANWLDPAGHSAGYITFRWIGADTLPVPHCKQVSLSDLEQSLPDNYRRVDAAARRRQIVSRRSGVINRFRI